MNPTQPSGQPEAMSGYRLVGRFLEACDCYAICPCWIDEVPDEDRCTGLFVWDITSGEAKGHDVAGLRVVSVSFHQGKRLGSRQQVMLFIDDRAINVEAAVAAGYRAVQIKSPEQLQAYLAERGITP